MKLERLEKRGAIGAGTVGAVGAEIIGAEGGIGARANGTKIMDDLATLSL